VPTASPTSRDDKKSRSRYSHEYENGLRDARVEKNFTRQQLSTRCSALKEKDDERYVTVSVSTIKQLEAGGHKPRLKTAVTLAAVVESEANLLFPLGLDDGIRNTTGKTRSPDNPKKGGRPRKRPN